MKVIHIVVEFCDLLKSVGLQTALLKEIVKMFFDMIYLKCILRVQRRDKSVIALSKSKQFEETADFMSKMSV